jgi:hypothetical protein
LGFGQDNAFICNLALQPDQTLLERCQTMAQPD